MFAGIDTVLEPTVDQDDFVGQIKQLGARREPTVFGMRTLLPSQGRADMPVAATERMTVIVKTYAEGGENALHSHPYEDHTFILLQGRATFFGEAGEIASLGPRQGILLPAGAYYSFQAEAGEPLVMIRIGCVTDLDTDQLGRIDTKGEEDQGWGKKNKTVELVLTDRFFE